MTLLSVGFSAAGLGVFEEVQNNYFDLVCATAAAEESFQNSDCPGTVAAVDEVEYNGAALVLVVADEESLENNFALEFETVVGGRLTNNYVRVVDVVKAIAGYWDYYFWSTFLDLKIDKCNYRIRICIN